MGNTSDGYTIIEVLIVTAISTLLLISAFAVFSGKSRETQFSQAMQDLNSKLQNYVAQVKAGNFPGSEGYTCAVAGSPPRAGLTATASNAGTNQDCIFLGRAIEVVPGDNNLYAYTVLGNRDKYDAGGADTGDPAGTLEEANPEPAMVSGDFVLTDNYQVPYGLTLVSSKASGVSGDTDLVGFYTNLETNTSGATASGSTILALRGYPFTSLKADHTQGIKNCIEESPPCDGAGYISQWNLCFSDSEKQRQALLSVNGGPSGITTQLSFTDCS